VRLDCAAKTRERLPFVPALHRADEGRVPTGPILSTPHAPPDKDNSRANISPPPGTSAKAPEDLARLRGRTGMMAQTPRSRHRVGERAESRARESHRGLVGFFWRGFLDPAISRRRPSADEAPIGAGSAPLRATCGSDRSMVIARLGVGLIVRSLPQCFSANTLGESAGAVGPLSTRHSAWPRPWTIKADGMESAQPAQPAQTVRLRRSAC